MFNKRKIGDFLKQAKEMKKALDKHKSELSKLLDKYLKIDQSLT